MKTDLPLTDPVVQKTLELILADADENGECSRFFSQYVEQANLGFNDPFESMGQQRDPWEVHTAVVGEGLIEAENAVSRPRVPGMAQPPPDLEDLIFDDEPIELAPVEVAAPQKAAKPRKKSPAGDPSLGKGQVPWRAPESQAEHMAAIRGSHPLKKNARLVAFEAHVQLGITSAVENRPFPTVKRELTSSYLAMLTGLSDKAVRLAMAEVVRLGFLRRIDNGKGGRNKANKATYMAVVPEWTS